MKKVRSLSKKKTDEISALIGASFRDHPYEPGEGGSKPFFPSKAAMTEYMKSFVIASMESGAFYSTDHGEGYILITDTKGNHPNFKSIVKMAKGKCDRYVHQGMKLVQTRTAAGCKIYDLMYSKEGVN